MLPDFPETKQRFSRFFQTYMRLKIRQSSPYGAVQTRIHREGRTMKITRTDQSESISDMEQLSVRGEITFNEIENLTFENAIKKLDAIIADMVRKQTHFIRERISSDLPASQIVDAKGRKFDAQLFIDMLETIQVDFYPDGTPHEIIVDGPLFTAESMTSAEKEFESNPELKREFDEVMEKKKEEWRAREADRKLVG